MTLLENTLPVLPWQAISCLTFTIHVSSCTFLLRDMASACTAHAATSTCKAHGMLNACMTHASCNPPQRLRLRYKLKKARCDREGPEDREVITRTQTSGKTHSPKLRNNVHGNSQALSLHPCFVRSVLPHSRAMEVTTIQLIFKILKNIHLDLWQVTPGSPLANGDVGRQQHGPTEAAVSPRW
jgi:hypothetical protein